MARPNTEEQWEQKKELEKAARLASIRVGTTPRGRSKYTPHFGKKENEKAAKRQPKTNVS